jgi:transposase
LGRTAKVIADEEGLTTNAVYGIVKRYRHQNSAHDQKRSGRPHSLTDQDKLHINTIVDPWALWQFEYIIQRAGLDCHRTTIRRYLFKEGIQHKLALRRPFLNPKAVQLRRDFCEKNRYENQLFWHNWRFSDKVSIDRTDGDYTKWSFYRLVSLNSPCIRSYSDHATGRETSQGQGSTSKTTPSSVKNVLCSHFRTGYVQSYPVGPGQPAQQEEGYHGKNHRRLSTKNTS